MSATEQFSKSDLLNEMIYNLYSQAELMVDNEAIRLLILNDVEREYIDEEKALYLNLYSLWKHSDNSSFISNYLQMTKGKNLLGKQEKLTRAVMIDILRDIN
jgi:hypothetical protein